MTVNVDQINERVDAALKSNRRAESTVIVMSGGIFVAGLLVLFLSYWIRNPYIAAVAVLLNGFLYWPIREVRKIRRENLTLQILPSMIEALPPKDALREIVKCLTYLRDGKS
jgi:hypothetical protein